TTEAATVQVIDAKSQEGTLRVVVSESNLSRKVTKLQVAAWTKADQSDLHWYVTTGDQGSFSLTVDQRNHKYNAGLYTVHAYVTYDNGSSNGVNLGSYTLNKTNYIPQVATSYEGTGVYRITISDVVQPEQVKVAVWGDVNGQNDLRWYNAGKAGDYTWTITVDAKTHGETGLYHVHIYQGNTGLLATNMEVSRSNFDLPYYSQRDSRWAETYFGAYNMGYAGCVPTSIAMVLSALDGRTVLPTEVASYLYNNTNTFNKIGAGTSSSGIFAAASHYGMTVTDLGSYAGLVNALQEGHYVLGAVQNNKFVRNGTHEMVFAGYSNGNTYVRDPYNANNNGWYSVAALFNEQ
ncbi:GBS Bsp-like repeat-containing protein, partial [Streptococcus sp. DD12]|uniref:GBS Bsp-like repeat-containing protein n=1 Tax=Streptococcus sp. DD12 TaxID=1777880 RepID=UPI000AABBA40